LDLKEQDTCWAKEPRKPL